MKQATSLLLVHYHRSEAVRTVRMNMQSKNKTAWYEGWNEEFYNPYWSLEHWLLTKISFSFFIKKKLEEYLEILMAINLNDFILRCIFKKDFQPEYSK